MLDETDLAVSQPNQPHDVAPDRWRVHLTLNSKGGIGKSFVTIMLAQYEIARGRPIRCFDGDATTSTLSAFAALKATRLQMMKSEQKGIDQSQLDIFFEAAVTEECDVLLDTGASTYVPFMGYALENDLFGEIEKAGREVVVHVIVVGNGQTLNETLNDLDNLCKQLPSFVTITVWLNEHQGPIESAGKTFQEMAVYDRYKHRISAIVTLPQRTEATFGRDINAMMLRRLTFDEATNHPDFNIPAKSRLHRVRKELFDQLAVVLP